MSTSFRVHDRAAAVTTALRVLCLAALFAACRDDGSKTHVYRAPRPVQAPPPVVVDAPPAPDVPIGTHGADARITAVTDAATGAPVALTDIRVDFSVLTLVARGPGHWAPDRNARIELVVDGPTDTAFVLPLAPNPSVIIAHAFVVPVARDGGAGLRAGNYSAHVQLVMRGRQALAMSTPIYFVAR